MVLNQNEKEYRGLMMRIGGALLIFLGLITFSQSLYVILGEVLPELIGETAGFLVSNLLYAAMYLASFMLPVAFFRLFSKRTTTEPMRLAPRLTMNTPLLIFASIGLILASSVINNYIIEPFIAPDFDYSILFVSFDYSENYKVVVQFIAISLVPGICEEFLFRGMILSNLMPYGKTGAVIASALLFGIMHQNPMQMFYATMAGLVLGFLYIYTESILCCTLVHILNNAFSVFIEALAARLPESDANAAIAVIEGLLFVVAAVSILVLILKNKKGFLKKPELLDGVFGSIPAEAEGYMAIPVDPARKIRLFFSPTIIIFLAVAAVQMLSVLFLLAFGSSLSEFLA